MISLLLRQNDGYELPKMVLDDWNRVNILIMEISDKPQTIEFIRKKYRFSRANLFDDFIHSFSL